MSAEFCEARAPELRRWEDSCAVDGGAGSLDQPGRAVLFEAAQPFAHRGHGSREQPCGRLDADLFGTLHQPQAMVVGVFHLTHQIELTSGDGHDAAILLASRRPALPPAGRLSPTASYRSNTSTSPGGYDVTGLLRNASEHDEEPHLC